MLIVMIMYKQDHVMSLTYPMTSEDSKFMGFIFVNDAVLIIIGNGIDTLEEFCVQQQQGMLF